MMKGISQPSFVPLSGGNAKAGTPPQMHVLLKFFHRARYCSEHSC